MALLVDAGRRIARPLFASLAVLSHVGWERDEEGR